MPEPTPDPEVAQFLSSIQDLIDKGRSPARPAPLLLRPEQRVGGEPAAPRSAPPAPAPLPGSATGWPGAPRTEAPLSTSDPVIRDAEGMPPAPSAPKASAARGDVLLLERPVAPPAPSRPQPAMPLLILGAPVPMQDLAQVPDAEPLQAVPEAEPLVLRNPVAATSKAAPLLLKDPISSLDGNPQPAAETPPDPESAPSLASAPDLSEEDAYPSGDQLVQESLSENPDAAPAMTANPVLPADEAPQPEASSAAQIETPQSSHPELLDLSTFLPLASLPPSIALLRRGERAPLLEAARDDTPAPTADRAADPIPDWPELRARDQGPDVVPSDDDASKSATPLSMAAQPGPEDGLRDRVATIVSQEVRRQVGDLRRVVREEVRDVLAERDLP